MDRTVLMHKVTINLHKCILELQAHRYLTKNPGNTDGAFVGLLGFEPRQTESKSVVLPLHHNPKRGCKNKGSEGFCQTEMPILDPGCWILDRVQYFEKLFNI